jgi:probable HAF family extracellular repeat protein
VRTGEKLCLAVVIFLEGICFAAPHPRYRVVDLGVLPNGTRSVATALNDKGEVVGDCETPEGTHAFLFSNGEMIDVNSSLQFWYHGATFTSSESHARDINNRSEIIGGGRRFASGSEFLYLNGVVSYYPATYPYIDNQIFPVFFWLNDLGHIGGLGGSAGLAAVTDRERIWFYPLSTGYVLSAGLNNRDETTGHFYPPEANGSYQPAIFRLSGVERIPLPPGAVSGAGWDINDSGHVVGGYAVLINGSEAGRGFFYHDGVTDDIPSAGLTKINNFDEAIGSSGDGAFVFSGGKTYLLSEAVRSNSEFAIQQVNDINNDGVIAGSAIHNGQERAVVFIPLNRHLFQNEHSHAAHRTAWWTRVMSPKRAANF